MPAYMICQYDTNPEYEAYKAAVKPLNEKVGARILTKPGTAKVLEGNWPFQNAVLIEFESREAAEAFNKSEEYLKVKALRKGAPPITVVLVDG